MRYFILTATTLLLLAGMARGDGLWDVYAHSFAHAKYIDLTHTIAPGIPVWRGFAPSAFAPTVDPLTGKPYTYKVDGFEASHYDLQTDQLGTQLDPPAHWAPEYPAIDELPATYSLRPLVVISIVPQVKKNFGYQMQVGRRPRLGEAAWPHSPAGSVVFIRSDWSKRWPDPKLAVETQFPGVTLAALQFLHLQRHILFHGHEALDTDTTPTLGGRILAAASRLCPGRGRRQSRQGGGDGLPGRVGFPKLKAARAAMPATSRSARATGNTATPPARATRRCHDRRTRCTGIRKRVQGCGDAVQARGAGQPCSRPSTLRSSSIAGQ